MDTWTVSDFDNLDGNKTTHTGKSTGEDAMVRCDEIVPLKLN